MQIISIKNVKMIKNCILIVFLVPFLLNAQMQFKNSEKNLFTANSLKSHSFNTNNLLAEVSINNLNKNSDPFLKEAGLGILFGTALGFGVGYLAFELSNKSDMGPLVDGVAVGYIGYIIGTSSGVYLGARSNNIELSYLKTLLSGLVGAGTGIALLYIFTADQSDGAFSPFVAFPILMPLAANLIYVNRIAIYGNKIIQKISLNSFMVNYNKNPILMFNLRLQF